MGQLQGRLSGGIFGRFHGESVGSFGSLCDLPERCVPAACACDLSGIHSGYQKNQ